MRRIILALVMILGGCSSQQPGTTASSNDVGATKAEKPAASPNIQTVKNLALSLPKFLLRLTIFPRDESAQWRGIENFKNGSLFGVMDVVGCGNGRDRLEPVAADVANFNGRLNSGDPSSSSEDSAFRILDGLGFFDVRTRTITSRFEPQIYHCQVFNDRMKQWVAEHSGLIDASRDPPGLLFAARTRPRFEFENEYRTELPLKGQVPVVSLRFTYELHPLMPGLTANGPGSGNAKAFLDSDSGQWTFLEFQLRDPDVVYTPSPGQGART